MPFPSRTHEIRIALTLISALAAACVPDRSNPHDPDNRPYAVLAIRNANGDDVRLASRTEALTLDATGTVSERSDRLLFSFFEIYEAFDGTAVEVPLALDGTSATLAYRSVDVHPQDDAASPYAWYDDGADGRADVALRVVARDAHGASSTAEVLLGLKNAGPVSSAGADLLVSPAWDGTARLDGSASLDPDGVDTLRFRWRQVTGVPWPGLDAVEPDQPVLELPPHGGRERFVTFELEVSDGIAPARYDRTSVAVQTALWVGRTDSSVVTRFSGRPASWTSSWTEIGGATSGLGFVYEAVDADGGSALFARTNPSTGDALLLHLRTDGEILRSFDLGATPWASYRPGLSSAPATGELLFLSPGGAPTPYFLEAGASATPIPLVPPTGESWAGAEQVLLSSDATRAWVGGNDVDGAWVVLLERAGQTWTATVRQDDPARVPAGLLAMDEGVDGSVWVAGSQGITRLDELLAPAVGVLDVSALVSPGPVQIASTPEELWFMGHESPGFAFRLRPNGALDPSTAVTHERAGTYLVDDPYSSHTLTYERDARRLWVIQGNTMTGFRADTGELPVLERIRTTSIDGCPQRASNATLFGCGISSGVVVRPTDDAPAVALLASVVDPRNIAVDPRNGWTWQHRGGLTQGVVLQDLLGATRATFPGLVPAGPIALDAAADALWMSGEENGVPVVRRLSLGDGSSTDLPDAHGRLLGVAPDAGVVWTTRDDGTGARAFSTGTGIERTLSDPGGLLPLLDPDQTTIDPVRGDLWASTVPAAPPARILRIPADGAAVEAFTDHVPSGCTFGAPRHLAFDRARESVWFYDASPVGCTCGFALLARIDAGAQPGQPLAASCLAAESVQVVASGNGQGWSIFEQTDGYASVAHGTRRYPLPAVANEALGGSEGTPVPLLPDR